MSLGEVASSPSFVGQALPKAQPPTPLFSLIDTAYSTAPVNDPDPATYNFQLSKKKRTDMSLLQCVGYVQQELEFYYCYTSLIYGFTKTFENEALNSQTLLCPMYKGRCSGCTYS